MPPRLAFNGGTASRHEVLGQPRQAHLIANHFNNGIEVPGDYRLHQRLVRRQAKMKRVAQVL